MEGIALPIKTGLWRWILQEPLRLEENTKQGRGPLERRGGVKLVGEGRHRELAGAVLLCDPFGDFAL